MKFKKEQIVELSHPLINNKEHFTYVAKPEDISLMRRDYWYLECTATLCAHAGTHVEVPYHHMIDGMDCMAFPVERLIGEAIVINCLGKKAGDPITLQDVKKAEGRIEKGDMIFLYCGFDKYFRTDDWEPYPYITPEALEWMLSYEPKCIGTDASGVEVPGVLNGEPIHVTCFKKGVAIIESMTNLGAIENERTTAFVLALPMQGMDASPVRIVAIRDWDAPKAQNKSEKEKKA